MNNTSLESRINNAIENDIPFKNITLYWYEQLNILNMIYIINKIINDEEITDDPERSSINTKYMDDLRKIYNIFSDGPQQG